MGLIVGAYFWMNRAKNAANLVGEIADTAQTALGAARRFGFRRQANKHPVECIEDENLAIGSLVMALFELGNGSTGKQRTNLLVALQKQLSISLLDAEEIMTLGHWFIQECNGPSPAVKRLSRKAWKLAGTRGLERVEAIVVAIYEGVDIGMSDRQVEAMDDVKRAFKI